MNQELKNEALEQLKKEIQFGFYNQDDLLEAICDMFYNEEDFDTEWLKKEIDKQFANHQKESLSWKKPTDFERLIKSFDELIKEEIVALHKAGYTRQDGESDCLEIIDELKALGINAKGYCYYHTQDLERAIGEEKTLFIGFDSYNQNDVLAREIAEKIVQVLKNNEFDVDWNGSLNTRIKIGNIDWKKSVDNIDYNYERVFQIIKKQNANRTSKTNPKKDKPFWKFW